MSREGFYLKSDAEIAAMREPGLITAAALRAVAEAIRPGVSTLELDEIADATIRAAGARSNFQLVPGYHHTICASINHEIVHGIPARERILQAGDIVSIDAGAEKNGWNGDSAITVIVPGAESSSTHPGRQRLSTVTEESLWVGIAAFAKAERLGEVGTAIEQYVSSQGRFGILQEYVGHGIGRSMHEEPPVFNYRTTHQGPRVEPGLVIAIEPMITAGSNRTKVLSDEWTVVTRDGSDASHWEHSVARHSRGVWVLTAEDGGAARLAPYGVTPVPPGLD